ncbi:hypothetical protein [Azonexus sp.]|uniref:hypothetical protein n=1 Tax=Azonexus sp. TaxID=1872668 RepID=UPI0035B27541
MNQRRPQQTVPNASTPELARLGVTSNDLQEASQAKAWLAQVVGMPNQVGPGLGGTELNPNRFNF